MVCRFDSTFTDELIKQNDPGRLWNNEYVKNLTNTAFHPGEMEHRKRIYLLRHHSFLKSQVDPS